MNWFYQNHVSHWKCSKFITKICLNTTLNHPKKYTAPRWIEYSMLHRTASMYTISSVSFELIYRGSHTTKRTGLLWGKPYEASKAYIHTHTHAHISLHVIFSKEQYFFHSLLAIRNDYKYVVCFLNRIFITHFDVKAFTQKSTTRLFKMVALSL